MAHTLPLAVPMLRREPSARLYTSEKTAEVVRAKNKGTARLNATSVVIPVTLTMLATINWPK